MNNNDNKIIYPLHTSARAIVKKIPLVQKHDTIGEIENILIKNKKKFEAMDYVYVVDSHNKLEGVISIKQMFGQPKDALASAIMVKNPVKVRPNTDQEKAAILALKNKIKAVPVVDKDNKLIGVIPSHKILSITYNEATHNIFRFAGILNPKSLPEDIFETSLWKSFKHRMPWLIIGLFGGMFAAKIIGFFENTLETNIMLAAFIPLIVYMSDAVGTQMEAFIIRDLAINPDMKFFKYFLKQIYITFAIALVCSLALLVIILIFNQNLVLPFVLGFSLFVAIMSSVFTGLLIPYIVNRFKIDPANVSGPIATVIQDILSVVIYFSIATWLL